MTIIAFNLSIPPHLQNIFLLTETAQRAIQPYHLCPAVDYALLAALHTLVIYLGGVLQRRNVAKGDLAAQKADDPETARGDRSSQLSGDMVEGFLSSELGETNHEVTESCLPKGEEEESQYLIGADDSDIDVNGT